MICPSVEEGFAKFQIVPDCHTVAFSLEETFIWFEIGLAVETFKVQSPTI